MSTVSAASDGYKPSQAKPLNKRVTRILKGTATFDDRFVPDHEELVELIALLRSMGATIAFTTGVWDLFHIGHAQYMQRGKEETAKLYPQAEHIILVVGVDTDALTKERKGPTRPLVPEDERWKVLSHLRAVDIITPQYEADQLYRLISHDVRIVSKTTGDLPDRAEIEKFCANLVELEPQAETSTTARLRRITLDGSLDTLGKVEAGLQKLLDEVRSGLSK